MQSCCEIGEERIRRAGKKIKEESPLTTTKLDIGFRVFKVDSSNMEDVYYRPADVKQAQLDLFADNIKPDRTPEDLLFQVMLDLGITLSSSVDEEMLDGRKVFSTWVSSPRFPSSPAWPKSRSSSSAQTPSTSYQFHIFMDVCL